MIFSEATLTTNSVPDATVIDCLNQSIIQNGTLTKYQAVSGILHIRRRIPLINGINQFGLTRTGGCGWAAILKRAPQPVGRSRFVLQWRRWRLTTRCGGLRGG